MSAKGTTKKPVTKKPAKPVLGTVGFMYGGVLKVGTAWVFSTDTEEEVKEVYENSRNYLGRYVTCKYVPVENASDVCEKLKEELSDQHDYGSIYTMFSQALVDKLKETSGVDRCKNIKEKEEKEATAPADAEDETPPAKKGGKATPAEKAPTKKATTASSGKGKKAAVVEEEEAEEEAEAEDEGEEEAEDEGDEEEVDDVEVDDAEEEAEEEEDEPPAPPAKKGGKSTAAKATPAPAKKATPAPAEKAPVKKPAGGKAVAKK